MGSAVEDTQREAPAGTAAAAPSGGGALPGLRLDAVGSELERILRSLRTGISGPIRNSAGAEWLLDNETILRAAVRQVRQDLPRSFRRTLPRAAEDGTGGVRISNHARSILESMEWRFDAGFFLEALEETQRGRAATDEPGQVSDHRIGRAPVHGDSSRAGRTSAARAQAKTELTIGELWAFPAFLRLACLEKIVASAQGLAAGRGDGGRAADGDHAIAACVTSLRRIQAQDWTEFFLRASRVDAVLSGDPSGHYASMDFPTRDRYLKQVERLAAWSGLSEAAVARAAVEAARAAAATSPRDRHVGAHLVGGRREALERALRGRPRAATILRRVIRPAGPWAYLLAAAVLTGVALAALGAGLAAAGAPVAGIALVLAAALVPASTTVLALWNRVLVAAAHPQVLPKLDFSAGIPEPHRTLVAIPCLLEGPGEVRRLLEHLEIAFLGNDDPLLTFALLSDHVDADAATMPADADLLEAARRGVRELNARHAREGPPRFRLFHRERRWNPGEGKWMGWERKRGKIEELNRLLLGLGADGFAVCEGGAPEPGSVRYVITLDADTFLPPGTARRLAGALAHPLNRPEFRPGEARIASGYTVIQPRMHTLPASAARTLFARVCSGEMTLDLYTHAVSDVYQDLFGEGIYAGKGIYDVAAFHASLDGRVPGNALLSHDLFEGVHGRAALASDVVLLDAFPHHALAWQRRQARWIRGDWQLLPWLGRSVRRADGSRERVRLPLLSRWKILDNLRRSLQAPSLLVLLLLGSAMLPVPPWLWALGVLGAAFLPAILDGVVGLARSPFAKSPAAAAAVAGRSLRLAAARTALSVVFLPFEAFLAADAVARTLARVLVTRRHLLQWVPAARVERTLRRGVTALATVREMAAGPAAALAAGLVAWIRPEAAPAVLPLAAAWLLSPGIASWTGRPTVDRSARLEADEVRRLRKIARRTWHWFERFLTPDDHWLAPDNFQEDPGGIVARRTSPTNFGLGLLSVLAGYDLGFLTRIGMAARLRAALTTIEGLERHRGHWLNWYATRDLAPLLPRYVSTVDSGNLAACFLALKEGLREVVRDPVLRPARRDGLVDTIEVLADIVRGLDAGGSSDARPLVEHLEAGIRRLAGTEWSAERWLALLDELAGSWLPELDRRVLAMVDGGLEAADPKAVDTFQRWVERVRHHVAVLQRELQKLLPWVNVLKSAPAAVAGAAPGPLRDRLDRLGAVTLAPVALEEVPATAARIREEAAGLRSDAAVLDGGGREAVEAFAAALEDAAAAGSEAASGLVREFHDLAAVCERLVEGMDFRFLFDPARRLFRIGFDLTRGEHDPNHYDLFASECRLASYVAIAKGDVPPAHWMHLARPFTRTGSRLALLSWGGSMFEFLMPRLLLRHPRGSLMDEGCRAAVEVQIRHGRKLGLPWGSSESGFLSFDAQQNYQYRSFGVPGLGFRREIAADRVVAPYATVLALSVAPREALANLGLLERLGMCGDLGLYEAVDFTPSRAPGPPGRVRSYMAHHQGMILLAILNRLTGDRMAARFHRDRRIAGHEHLLHEQMPPDMPIERLPGAPETAPIRPPPPYHPWEVPARTALPAVHLLSNGRYHVLLTNSGAGGSSLEGDALLRGRVDPTAEEHGNWIFLRDQDSGRAWSAGLAPAGAVNGEARMECAPHRATFHRREHGIHTRLEVLVAPDSDVEIRRLRILNETVDHRRLLVTSAAEVVMGRHGEDRRHPAFQKLFVECGRVTDLPALIFRRRPRSKGEAPLYFGHAFRVEGDGVLETRAETDRERLLGRGGSWRRPVLGNGGRRRPPATGASLDPVASLSADVALPPHGATSLIFVWAAGRSAGEVQDLLSRLSHPDQAEWVEASARLRCERDLAQAGIPPEELPVLQRLLSVVMHPHRALRLPTPSIEGVLPSRTALWGFGISGDHPILLVRSFKAEGTPLIATLIRGAAWWRRAGMRVDLVILDDRTEGYDQPFRDKLLGEIGRAAGLLTNPAASGVFHVSSVQAGVQRVRSLEACASAILDADGPPIDAQIEAASRLPARLPDLVPTLPPARAEDGIAPLERPAGLLFDNGLGGFDAGARSYVIHLPPGQRPAAPWSNILANLTFGAQLTEAGVGAVFSLNSSENRLTPWSNDPVRDPPSVTVHVRDEETGQAWSVTPEPSPAAAPHEVTHRPGLTRYRHASFGLLQTFEVFVAREDPVLYLVLHLENRTERPRRLTVTCHVPWVLGNERGATLPHVITGYTDGTLLARNPFHEVFGARVAFLAASHSIHGLTCDRAEWLGRLEDPAEPAALRRCGLSGAEVAAADPCATIQVQVDLEAGGAAARHFVLGQGKDREEALRLAAECRAPEAAAPARAAALDRWEDLLGRIRVRTPEPAFDLLAGGWLLYQAVTCRLEARTGFYQPGGAFGFRDQIQDVLALLLVDPERARQHLLHAAGHQFEDGDVLHWWHPPETRGVRTRCSDDLLWLPFAVSEYVETTGDDAILDVPVPWLAGPALLPEEHDRFDRYPLAEGTASLYVHCLRAIARGDTSGQHGLPLIGTGDWNDGFDRLGERGRGESVWLGWFLHEVLRRFAVLGQGRGDGERALGLSARAEQLRASLHRSAWDGSWWLRAFDDDGRPVGTHSDAECRIDLIAQAWAVMAEGAADPERARSGMESAWKHLVNAPSRLVLLLDPPFDRGRRHPGYIRGYPPGVRENGGQYTHAAIWFAWAHSLLGHGSRVMDLFRLLNPILRSSTPSDAAQYRVEPYVLPGDVLSRPPHVGRGGWTWYTGSAAWLHRLAIERILGLRRRGSTFSVLPCIPPSWPGFELEWRHLATTFRIQVRNPSGVSSGVVSATLDGRPVPPDQVPLEDGPGIRLLEVTMGQADVQRA